MTTSKKRKPSLKLAKALAPAMSKKTWVQRIKDLPVAAKVGAAVGAGSLLVFGGAAFVPVAVGGGLLGGYYAVRKKIGGGARYSSCMTPERIKVYEQAIAELKDPEKLGALAEQFEKAGCMKEAEHLRKRANLRTRSAEEKQADQVRYRRAMADSDVSRIEREVSYFKGIGADGTAKNLMARVAALRAVQR